MKNLLISLSLLLVLISFGTLVFMDTAGAQNNLVGDLLNLPAPPPPNPHFGGPGRARDENFYNKKNPPGDDAPIEDLIEYWQTQSTNYSDLGYNIEPSRETLDRLLEAIEDKPELLGSLINVFPENAETADFVKKIYDAGGTEGEEGELNETIETWLKYHSKYYADELLEGSRQVGDTDEYVTNQDELLALSRVDFSRAQPILNQLYNDSRQPVSQTLARWALYRHAIDTDSLGDIERYRDELKATVENKRATPGMRDLAMDALIKEKDWSGREDWYIGLLEDETLADLRVNGRSYTGLTTIVLMAPPEKYMDRMLELLKSSTPAVRNAAVKNLALLIGKDSPEVVRALLPWLENPKWAKETGGERSRLVEALQSLAMPESVPGLINIMEELQTVKRRSGLANVTNANISSIPPEEVQLEEPVEIYRTSAIAALGTQKDARAVPALRRALNEVEEYERPATIKALLQSHGFSVAEQVDALEAIAKATGGTGIVANSNFSMPGNYSYRTSSPVNTDGPPPPPPPPPLGRVYTAVNSNAGGHSYLPKRPVTPEEIKLYLGAQLAENPEAEEALVTGVVDRIGVLDRRDPPTAAKLRLILQNWNGPAINAMLLRNLGTGQATLDSVVKLLSLRKELMEKQSTAVYDARDGGPLAFGITACILNNNNEYDAILAGENVESKIAMLACARLVRADLPVNKTAEYLGSSNKTLSLAAERYLESNDSPQARAAVLALHPNEARIMGATTYSAPGDAEPTESDFLTSLFASVPSGLSLNSYYMSPGYATDIKKTEVRLQKEVRENKDLLGVYAYDDNFIRIYKDKTVFSWEEDNARYHERPLTESEFDNFKNFLASSGVDTLPPFLSEPREAEDAEPEELLMLGPQGGRRVFLESGTKPQFFKDLDKAFEEMRKPPAKLHYWLEKDFPGLEILFSDDDLKAAVVWKNGADMRVLVDNQKQREEIDKELDALYSAETSKDDYDYEQVEKANRLRRLERQYEHVSWRKFAKGDLSAGAAQPAEMQVIPARDGLAVEPSGIPWRTSSAGIEVRANHEGLYKVSQGQLTKLQNGYYYEPFMVPGGRWALAAKIEAGTQLVRVNLLAGKEFRVEIPGHPNLRTVAYVPSVKRVLVAAAGYYGDADEDNRITRFLIDPETGAFQPVKGEFAPLTHQIMRPLQPAPGPDEFWAAIPSQEKNETQIGFYNARSFIFKPLQKVSRITFSSMDMWVDEKESKIYLVYAGHLLALPLKK